MSKHQEKIYRVLLLLSPFVLLALAEVFVRAFNFFPPPPLFLNVVDKGKVTSQLNPYVGQRYFNPQATALPTLYPEIFEQNKSDRTFRIFCLGGSTTAGFPFDYQVPFPQQLDYLLSQTYPEYHFEVINTGLSAINSFSVLDLLPEILEKEPDLILIYMGHNEFYGVYGSGSTFSIGQNGSLIRFYLRLQQFHLVQLLKHAIQALTPASPPDSDQESIMAAVIGDRSIAYRSEKYWQTLSNFEDNLQIILQKCAEQGVPVIMSSLVSNVKDLPPFDGNFAEPEVVAKEDTHSSFQTMGDRFFREDNLAESLQACIQAYKEDSSAAIHWYNLGKVYSALGDSIQADKYFTGAKDRDAVRFRASEDLNRIIEQQAQQFNTSIVDVQGIFRHHSKQRLIGKTLMSDHLHPNPQGYYLMASAFYREINRRGLLLNPDTTFLVQQTPHFVTPLDWNIGLLKIFKMINRTPFPHRDVEVKDYQPYRDHTSGSIAYQYIFRHQNWKKAHYDMAERYIKTKEYQNARQEYGAVSFYYPDEPQADILIARTYKAEENWRECEIYYQKALQKLPNNGMLHFQLGIAHWKQKDLDGAIEAMKNAISAETITQQQQLNARYYLAGFLGEAGKMQEAKQLTKAMIRDFPQYKPAQQLLRQLSEDK